MLLASVVLLQRTSINWKRIKNGHKNVNNSKGTYGNQMKFSTQ